MSDRETVVANWHEDPERPGVFVPDDGPVLLCSGDSLCITYSLVVTDDLSTGVVLPWADGVVTTSKSNPTEVTDG
jgi:hypothetical protein